MSDRAVKTSMDRSLEYALEPASRPRLWDDGRRRFPFPIPNGWFIVAESREIEPGGVSPLRYFDRDLVLLRTEQGAARLLSAYCSHLGAHLAAGGRVDGETLVCPFHGWCYATDTGACVDIPYGTGRIPNRARVRAFPTLERDGFIWAWFHLEGKPPFYEVPAVPEFGDPAWSDPVTFAFKIRTCAQEMAENNHDAVHFRFVHGTEAIPEEHVHMDGTYKKVTSMGGSFVRETFGLGLGVLHVGQTLTFLSSVTPIDHENVHVRWIFISSRSSGPGAAEQAGRSFLEGVSQDIPIWENKRYADRPVLLREERPILEHREWCKQFYSDPASAID